VLFQPINQARKNPAAPGFFAERGVFDSTKIVVLMSGDTNILGIDSAPVLA
jgi:hypothetical protein